MNQKHRIINSINGCKPPLIVTLKGKYHSCLRTNRQYINPMNILALDHSQHIS